MASVGRSWPLSVQDYYADPAVRARLHEYCGGTDVTRPTSAYVAFLYDDGTEHLTWNQAGRIPPDACDSVLGLGPDLARSLWDTKHLIFVLDLDHQNVDQPAGSFLHPAETFIKLESAYRATRRVLADFGVRALRLMTGRGYHFVGHIPLDHPCIDQLAALVPEPPGWLPGLNARRPPGVTALMSTRQARAAGGLGMLTEYLAHLVIGRAGSSSRIPVVVNGTVVGRGVVGRECASVDFSHAGDPLDVRMIRMAFSAYQWHRFRPDIFGDVVASEVAPFAAVPCGRRSLVTMLLSGRQLREARRQARTASVKIPDVADGIEKALRSYRTSKLAQFHRAFNAPATETGRPALETSTLPPCVTAAFATPNDLLLKPQHVQHATRALLLEGWTARQIADQIAACYKADWQWGDRWTRMHPATRAEFDVRVFAGMIVTGLDRMVDFNCVSAQEKGLCPGVGCPYDLRVARDNLRAKVRTS